MRTLLVSMGILVACSPLASAQRGMFAIPKKGTMLPEIKFYDEQGQPRSTSEFRDSYTVLVFGCLT